ncbi:MAG: TRAP transporter substrate-binding protein [Bacteroidota bacterium]
MKKISRKSFLTKGAAGLAGASLIGAGCSQEAVQGEQGSSPNIITQKKLEWTMVTTWGPNLPILGIGCKLFADWVREMSDGRLDIKVYGGGELVPAFEAFENVSNGNAQIGGGAPYYWAGKVAAAQFFATVPFGMNAQQMNAWIISGGGYELWKEVYEPFEVIPFPAGNTGLQMGGWFNKEINSLADIKGLKMRIPGLGGKVLTRAGGTAVNVPGQEIYTNLERGVIDATEWIGPYHDYIMGFHKIARYYYYPGWHEPGTNLEVFVNQYAYNELSSDLKAIIEAAAHKLNQWTLCEFEAQNAAHLSKILEEGDVELRSFPEDVLESLRNYTEEVLNEMAEDDPLSRKAYEAYKSFQGKAMSWAGYTERIFFDALQKKGA